mmetsp:Transcript_15200/g.40058  ORF Transcript_15200/g.40058 Transcript_15200/m.40058 type:complete len:226 (+) Transcript_15200:703-1380(+)
MHLCQHAAVVQPIVGQVAGWRRRVGGPAQGNAGERAPTASRAPLRTAGHDTEGPPSHASGHCRDSCKLHVAGHARGALWPRCIRAAWHHLHRARDLHRFRMLLCDDLQTRPGRRPWCGPRPACCERTAHATHRPPARPRLHQVAVQRALYGVRAREVASDRLHGDGQALAHPLAGRWDDGDPLLRNNRPPLSRHRAGGDAVRDLRRAPGGPRGVHRQGGLGPPAE